MAKKPSAVIPEVVDVVPVNADLQKVGQEVVTLTSFLQGVQAWGERVVAFKDRFVKRLEEARALTVPTSLEEDEALKAWLRTVNEEKRELVVEGTATASIHHFHRRLTGLVSAAEKPADEALSLGNRLHSAWVAAERDRVLREQDEQRRREEADARKKRDAELAELETRALEAEQATDDLSAREQAYVEARAELGKNPVDAAFYAKFSQPRSSAERLEKSPKIIRAIQANLDAQELRRQKVALREAPVVVTQTATVDIKAQADTKGDRTTKSADLFDEDAFVAALLLGKHGIPRDVITIDRAKLNAYARDLGKLIDRWPGVRYVEKTKVV